MTGQEKPGLLLMCHRLPYPPNKGDKIRSWHLLKFLAQHYSVYLGTFIDDPEDWQYRAEVESVCAQVKVINLVGVMPKIRAVLGLVSGQSLSVPWYYNGELKRWVSQLIVQKKITAALAYSSPMAQYLLPHTSLLKQSVIDLVDIDSDKWAQYAQKKPWPLSMLYRIEARRLFSYEAHITEKFHRSFFVSSTEALHFRDMLPAFADKVSYYNNGVDTEYFKPDNYTAPFSGKSSVLVFTGAMDYWPNVDAVTWFAKKILPALQADIDVQFYIVGSKPNKAVQALAQLPGVVVTGRVEDVRPYIAHASAVVAPMRIARGVQNKVLEGLAMDRVVVTSSLGLEGIDAVPGEEVWIADTEIQWRQILLSVLSGKLKPKVDVARNRVLVDFNWQKTLPTVLKALQGDNKND